MIENIKPWGYWNNYDNCKNEALKYNQKRVFSRKSSRSYDSCRRNGWIDELCSHMKSKNK